MISSTIVEPRRAAARPPTTYSELHNAKSNTTATYLYIDHDFENDARTPKIETQLCTYVSTLKLPLGLTEFPSHTVLATQTSREWGVILYIGGTADDSGRSDDGNLTQKFEAQKATK